MGCWVSQDFLKRGVATAQGLSGVGSESGNSISSANFCIVIDSYCVSVLLSFRDMIIGQTVDERHKQPRHIWPLRQAGSNIN